MKILNKFKKYIFLFAFAILGVFAFNTDLVDAVGVYAISTTSDFDTSSNHVYAGGNNMYYAYNGTYYAWSFVDSEWSSVSWAGTPSNLDGRYVSYINGYFYFSTGTYPTYRYDATINTWSVYNWSSRPSTLNMNNVYRIGDNYYYTASYQTYILNTTTNSWDSFTWPGNITGPENGSNVVKIGDNYYSMGGASSAQRVFNTATNTWDVHTWAVSRSSMYGSNVWSFAGDYYFSQNGEHRKLDISTNSWNIITLDGFYYFSGGYNVEYLNVRDGYTFVFNYGANFIVSDRPISAGGGYTEEDLENSYNSGYTAGYTAGETGGYNHGYTVGYGDGYEDGEGAGFNSGAFEGYTRGYDEGREDGVQIGYNEGYTLGYDTGYDEGYVSGADSKNNLIGVVGAIFTGPVTMLSAIFNFEFLGINLSALILSLTTLLVVIWLVKRFI